MLPSMVTRILWLDAADAEMKLVLIAMAMNADEYGLCTIWDGFFDKVADRVSVAAALQRLEDQGLIRDTGKRFGIDKKFVNYLITISQ